MHLYNQPYVHIYCLDEIRVSLVVTRALVAPRVLSWGYRVAAIKSDLHVP
jgi:hypothetical protein